MAPREAAIPTWQEDLARAIDSDVGPTVYVRIVPRRRRGLRDVRADRPAKPYRPDGTLDPREWEIACSSAGALALVVLRDEPWFVSARPIEVFEQGVELDVVVRWVSSEVLKKVPFSVDGYVVNVMLEGQRSEIHTIH